MKKNQITGLFFIILGIIITISTVVTLSIFPYKNNYSEGAEEEDKRSEFIFYGIAMFAGFTGIVLFILGLILFTKKEKDEKKESYERLYSGTVWGEKENSGLGWIL